MRPGWFYLLALTGLVLTLFAARPTEAADCALYDGEVCKSAFPPGTYVIPWVLQPFPGFVAALEEELVKQGLLNLTQVLASVDPLCGLAGENALCGKAFRVCNEFGNETVTYCDDVCDNFREYCTTSLNATGEIANLENCDYLTAPTNCHSLPFSGQVNEDFQCPEPLLMHPNPGEPKPSCLGMCCVPCEPNTVLYPVGVWSTVQQLVTAVQMTSLILLVVFVITYLLMEEKRTFPSSIVTCISFGLILFYFTILFGLGDTTRVHCADPVTPATGETNALCRTQAIFVHYGILAACMWYILLVINVYANVIFLSKALRDYSNWYHLICWGLPLIPMIVANATNRVGYTFGFWCITELGKYTTYSLMAPLAVCVLPSVLLNVHVLFKIAMVARNRKASIPAILKLQIRFFGFVMTALTILLFYWIQYEARLGHLGFDTNQPWLHDWLYCVMTGHGQDECAKVAEPFVPHIGLYTTSEVLAGMLGWVVFGFFWCREEIIVFWRATLLREKRKVIDPFNTSLNESSTNGRKTATQSRSNLSTAGAGDKDDLEMNN